MDAQDFLLSWCKRIEELTDDHLIRLLELDEKVKGLQTATYGDL